MKSLVFNVRIDAPPERRENILQAIRHWEGVVRAGCLSEHAKTPAIRRMCYAQIADEADLDAILTRLRDLPEIESAAIPAERHLA